MPRMKRPPRIKGKPLKATQRTLAYLRRLGYHAESCERFVPRVEGEAQKAIYKGGFRKDLFGFADVMAYHPNRPGVLLVQCTSRQQMTMHLRKYRRDSEVAKRIHDWLVGDKFRAFLLHGWECVEVMTTSPKAKSPTKPSWDLTERVVQVEDVQAAGAAGGK